MKHLAPDEVTSAVPVMTRADKLHYWANLIRRHDAPITLVHGLEYWSPSQLRELLPMGSGTPFDIAAADPHLKEMGLTSSVESATNFFELTRDELHEFTCDCGGRISNANMAKRIERFANPNPPRTFGSMFRR